MKNRSGAEHRHLWRSMTLKKLRILRKGKSYPGTSLGKKDVQPRMILWIPEFRARDSVSVSGEIFSHVL